MNPKKTIVVIEDEQFTQQYLAENLSKKGYIVYAYDSAELALASEIIEVADAVIMDIKLPGIDGVQAMGKIKKEKMNVPVVILSAYSDLNYRLAGFETGADDYIIKPFFLDELVARLKAVIKRYELIPGGKIRHQIENLTIDVRLKKVFRGAELIKLSVTEFNILLLLADAEGKPVNKDEIMRKIWKGRYSVRDNTIEVYINLLRNKIDKTHTQKLIHTKTGFGYYISGSE